MKMSRKRAERLVYIVIVIALVLYGILKDWEAAERLIGAVKDAFSILIL